MILLAAVTWLAALVARGAAVPQSEQPAQGGPEAASRGPDAGGQGAQQRKPKPSPFAGPEDARLAMWQGAWQENVRYAGDPEDKPSGEGKWLARQFYGLFVVINYQGKGPEGNYNAHGVMAYDHEAKNYGLWWFDDSGNVGQYTGTWKDDSTLVFELKKTTGGKAFRERMTYTHASDGEIHTKIEQAWGNEPYKFYMEAVAHKMPLGDMVREGEGTQRRPGQRRRQPPQNQ
jgi:hypothetical protein